MANAKSRTDDSDVSWMMSIWKSMEMSMCELTNIPDASSMTNVRWPNLFLNPRSHDMAFHFDVNYHGFLGVEYGQLAILAFN